MQGFSGTYAINGVQITQPTVGRWLDKDTIAFDGNGRPIYPAFSSFELEWDLLLPSELKTINDYFNYSNASGTVVVDLPKWGDADYKFYSYSGTQLGRPTVGDYFVGYVKGVHLVVSNIRV